MTYESTKDVFVDFKKPPLFCWSKGCYRLFCWLTLATRYTVFLPFYFPLTGSILNLFICLTFNGPKFYPIQFYPRKLTPWYPPNPVMKFYVVVFPQSPPFLNSFIDDIKPPYVCYGVLTIFTPELFVPCRICLFYIIVNGISMVCFIFLLFGGVISLVLSSPASLIVYILYFSLLICCTYPGSEMVDKCGVVTIISVARLWSCDGGVGGGSFNNFNYTTLNSLFLIFFLRSPIFNYSSLTIAGSVSIPCMVICFILSVSYSYFN